MIKLEGSLADKTLDSTELFKLARIAHASKIVKSSGRAFRSPVMIHNYSEITFTLRKETDGTCS